MAQKKVISAFAYAKNKREIEKLYTMGYKYDLEKNPKKKAAMEKEIIKMCDRLRPKLGLKDISDEEARRMLIGGSLGGGSGEEANGSDEASSSENGEKVESVESGESAESAEADDEKESGSEKGSENGEEKAFESGEEIA